MCMERELVLCCVLSLLFPAADPHHAMLRDTAGVVLSCVLCPRSFQLQTLTMLFQLLLQTRHQHRMQHPRNPSLQNRLQEILLVPQDHC